jgi:hypothetical protein
MNGRPYFFILIGLLLATSIGCSTNTCGQRMTFREWFSNRPRPLRDLFARGDECNDCFAPAGQMEMGNIPCPTGTCMSGTSNPGEGYYPADSFAGSASMPTDSRIQTGYPPTFIPGELNSGLRSSAELEIPPMYGRPN